MKKQKFINFAYCILGTCLGFIFHDTLVYLCSNEKEVVGLPLLYSNHEFSFYADIKNGEEFVLSKNRFPIISAMRDANNNVDYMFCPPINGNDTPITSLSYNRNINKIHDISFFPLPVNDTRYAYIDKDGDGLFETIYMRNNTVWREFQIEQKDDTIQIEKINQKNYPVLDSDSNPETDIDK